MSFPLAAALICPDLECSTVFDSRVCRNVCPRCQSTETYPVEKFLRARDGAAYEARTLDELAGLRITFPVAS